MTRARIGLLCVCVLVASGSAAAQGKPQGWGGPTLPRVPSIMSMMGCEESWFLTLAIHCSFCDLP